MRRTEILGGLIRTSVALLAIALTAAAPVRAEGNTSEISIGERLYSQKCSLCDGSDAKGRTEVAALLKIDTPDLTRIAARRKGWFPEILVREIVDGRFAIHGPRAMPIWGLTMSQEEMIAITEYLFGLQDPLP